MYHSNKDYRLESLQPDLNSESIILWPGDYEQDTEHLLFQLTLLYNGLMSVITSMVGPLFDTYKVPNFVIGKLKIMAVIILLL